MSKRVQRPLLLLILAALALALPGFGATPAPTPPPAAPIAGCASGDLFDLQSLPPLEAPAPISTISSAPIDPLASIATGVTFTGSCKCSCTLVRNCNTSADCGGAPCLRARTCC